MKRRDVCGVLVLLIYLLGVGLVTGPSFYQLLAGRLPEPKLELIPFVDIVGVVVDSVVHHHGAGIILNIFGNIVMLCHWDFYFHCSGHILAAQNGRSCLGCACLSALS